MNDFHNQPFSDIPRHDKLSDPRNLNLSRIYNLSVEIVKETAYRSARQFKMICWIVDTWVTELLKL